LATRRAEERALLAQGDTEVSPPEEKMGVSRKGENKEGESVGGEEEDLLREKYPALLVEKGQRREKSGMHPGKKSK